MVNSFPDTVDAGQLLREWSWQENVCRIYASDTHPRTRSVGSPSASTATPPSMCGGGAAYLVKARRNALGYQPVDVGLFVDQGYIGERPADDAAEHSIQLEVIKLPEARHDFVLLPQRRVVEHPFAWAAHFRRLARDYKRLPETVVGLRFLGLCLPDAPAIGYCCRAQSITRF